MPSYKLFVFDIGTTGTNPNLHSITSLAVVEYASPPSHFSTLVSPTSSKYGVPSFSAAFAKFAAFIRHTTPPGDTPLLIAHNASFDASFLVTELVRTGISIPSWQTACSVELAREVLPELWSYKQEDLADELDVIVQRKHHSGDDVLVLRDILCKLDVHADVRKLIRYQAEPLSSMAARGGVQFEMSFVTTESNSSSTMTSHHITDTSPSQSSPQGRFITTRTGRFYHADEECYNLRSARQLFRTNSPASRLKPCYRCCNEEDSGVGNDDSVTVSTVRHASRRDASPEPPPLRRAPSIEYITTRTGKYYHFDAECYFLRRASRLIPVKSVPPDLQPCWKCSFREVESSSRSRYETRSTYYSDKTKLSSNPTQIVQPQENEGSGNATEKPSQQYFITRTGNRYHVDEDCSGLSRATEKISCWTLPVHLNPCSKCCGERRVGAQSEHRDAETSKEETLRRFDAFWKTGSGAKFHTNKDCRSLRGRSVYECNPMEESKDPCRLCSLELYQEWEMKGLVVRL